MVYEKHRVMTAEINEIVNKTKEFRSTQNKLWTIKKNEIKGAYTRIQN